jgi:uncharacterized protein (TIGR00725 family)
VGAELARRGIGLVYGGGRRGLMGVLADSALKAGGEVIGVMPRSMVEREWAHEKVTELVLCDSIHERKAMMAGRAEAFIALPGGLGTLEEIFEVWSWRQLGLLAKPVGFLDADARRTARYRRRRFPSRVHSGRPRRRPRPARSAGCARGAAAPRSEARTRSLITLCSFAPGCIHGARGDSL